MRCRGSTGSPSTSRRSRPAPSSGNEIALARAPSPVGGWPAWPTSSRADRAVPTAPTGLYLGESGRGPLLAGAEQGVLVLGPPRSGKTSALVVPNVIASL